MPNVSHCRSVPQYWNFSRSGPLPRVTHKIWRENEMMKAIVASLGAALLIGSTAASSAAPLTPATATTVSLAIDGTIINAQWRGRRGHHGHRGFHRHHRRGGHWHHGHSGIGPAIGGLAVGALIGGAIASSAAPANSAVAYCMNRFKSYDPASGTYLGYDGFRHPCP